MTSWRWTACIGEGVRSLAAGGLVTAALALGSTTCLALPAVIDARAVVEIISAEDRWLDQGGDILIATRSEEGLSASRCESMNSVDGVEAAFGAQRLRGGYGTSAAPDASIAVVLATPGAPRFLESSSQGVIVSLSASTEIGHGPAIELMNPRETSSAPGSPPSAPPDGLVPPSGPLPVTTATDLEVLGVDYSHAILIPSGAGGVVEKCFIRASPQSLEWVRAAIPGLLADGTTDRPVIVSDRLLSTEFSRDYSEEYAARATALGPWLGGAAMGLFWLVVRWFRRTEDAIYATLGARATERAVIHGSAWVVLVTLAASASAALGACLALLQGPYDARLVSAFASHVFESLLIGVSVASVVTTAWFVAPRRDVLSTLKGR